MLIRLPKAVLVPLVVAFAACSSAAGSNAVPAAGYDTGAGPQKTLPAILDSAPAVTGGHLIVRKLSIRPNVRPDAGAPATLIDFVADGPNQSGVPCIDCVSGASTGDNVGMTGPYSYVLSNYYWQYELAFTDISYTGKCKLAWAITAGKKTIDSFSVSIDLKASGKGGYVLYAVARAPEKYSGAATLTGKYTCGKESASLQAPLHFE